MDRIYGMASCLLIFYCTSFCRSAAGQMVVQMRKPIFSFIGGLQAQIKIELAVIFSIHLKLRQATENPVMSHIRFIYGGAKYARHESFICQYTKYIIIQRLKKEETSLQILCKNVSSFFNRGIRFLFVFYDYFTTNSCKNRVILHEFDNSNHS